MFLNKTYSGVYAFGTLVDFSASEVKAVILQREPKTEPFYSFLSSYTRATNF